MKNEQWVLPVLQAVNNHTVDHRGLNRLIELTQSFACTYLKYRYKNLSNFLMGEDVSLNEMAVDAIAALFERDETGSLIRIIKAFLNWEPAIDNEEQAVFFINRLAAKSTEKYVSRLLRESDPFFSKILHSVNYLIESRGYKKKQILGTTYIVYDEEVNTGMLPSNQFVYDLPVYLFSKKNNILNDIFDYVKENTDRARAIPLNALVIKIKKTGLIDFEMTGQAEIKSTFEIESIVDKAVETAFDKLEFSYLRKNKIDERESEAIKKALLKIVIDLQDGGISTGLHKYLIEEMPSLSFEYYKEKYQNMFEYLLKILKKEIIHHMEE